MRWKTLRSGRNLYQLRMTHRDVMTKYPHAPEEDEIDSHAEKIRFFSERNAWEFFMHFLQDHFNRPYLLDFIFDEFRHTSCFDLSHHEDEWLAEILAWSVEHDDVRIYVLEDKFKFPILPEKKEPPPPPPAPNTRTWFELQLLWSDSGEPVKYLQVVIQGIDGRTIIKSTDGDGIIRIDQIDPGAVETRCSFQGVTLADCVVFAGAGPVNDQSHRALLKTPRPWP